MNRTSDDYILLKYRGIPIHINNIGNASQEAKNLVEAYIPTRSVVDDQKVPPDSSLTGPRVTQAAKTAADTAIGGGIGSGTGQRTVTTPYITMPLYLYQLYYPQH